MTNKKKKRARAHTHKDQLSCSSLLFLPFTLLSMHTNSDKQKKTSSSINGGHNIQIGNQKNKQTSTFFKKCPFSYNYFRDTHTHLILSNHSELDDELQFFQKKKKLDNNYSFVVMRVWQIGHWPDSYILYNIYMANVLYTRKSACPFSFIFYYECKQNFFFCCHCAVCSRYEVVNSSSFFLLALFFRYHNLFIH